MLGPVLASMEPGSKPQTKERTTLALRPSHISGTAAFMIGVASNFVMEDPRRDIGARGIKTQMSRRPTSLIGLLLAAAIKYSTAKYVYIYLHFPVY